MNFQVVLRKKIPQMHVYQLVSLTLTTVLDLEEDPATQDAYAKLYDRTDVTSYDSYLLAFQICYTP